MLGLYKPDVVETELNRQRICHKERYRIDLFIIIIPILIKYSLNKLAINSQSFNKVNTVYYVNRQVHLHSTDGGV
jgi:hypothetical protein